MDLLWTCFSIDPPNGNYKVEEGYCNTNTRMRIPRADVAAFMLKCLDSNQYDRKGLAIASTQGDQ
jgi:hypothetical protein